MGHLGRRPGLGSSGQGGGGGGGSTLPALPGADGIYDLVVSGGVGSWQLVGGDKILTFTGLTPGVEVGTSLASVNWAATFNVAPSAITISWSGVASGSTTLTGPFTTSASGTITGPFTSAANNAKLIVSITCTFPDGVHAANQSTTWEAKIVYGSVATGTITIDQAGWNTLNALNSQLRPVRAGSYAFTSAIGFDQVFACLTSLYPGTWTDPSTGFTYPTTSLGTATITENGTSQNVTFFTLGNPGSTITWVWS
jgi:hypothetical protein